MAPEREFPALLVVWAYQQKQLFFWKRAIFSRVSAIFVCVCFFAFWQVGKFLSDGDTPYPLILHNAMYYSLAGNGLSEVVSTSLHFSEE